MLHGIRVGVQYDLDSQNTAINESRVLKKIEWQSSGVAKKGELLN